MGPCTGAASVRLSLCLVLGVRRSLRRAHVLRPAATLVDVVSTAALLTVCDNSGVSLDLNCTYLSSARAGERVRVTARVLKAGRSTAVLSVELQTVGDGVLVAQGRHTKFLLGLGGLDVRQSLRSLL